MKKVYILILVAIVSTIFWDCSKSSSTSNPVVDLGASASGTYTGKLMYLDTIPATVIVTKASNITVNFHVTFTGGPMDYSGINVTDGGNGVIVLSLGTPAVTGTINGKTLTCIMTGFAKFSGTKP